MTDWRVPNYKPLQRNQLIARTTSLQNTRIQHSASNYEAKWHCGLTSRLWGHWWLSSVGCPQHFMTWRCPSHQYGSCTELSVKLTARCWWRTFYVIFAQDCLEAPARLSNLLGLVSFLWWCRTLSEAVDGFLLLSERSHISPSSQVVSNGELSTVQ